MNNQQDWNPFSGFDTDGPTIHNDLLSMKDGKLADDQVDELLADLVRDGAISDAAIPSLTYLTGNLDKLSPSARMNCRYAACLIVGIDTNSNTSECGSKPFRSNALKQLLFEASKCDLSEDWIISIAAVMLLLNKDQISYKKLIHSGMNPRE